MYRVIVFVLGAVVYLFITTEPNSVLAQGGWAVGKTVGLQQGTCIREGPGFGYFAHTRVPESDWTVVVIDGPRTADGKIWYDTSRRAAGDPSGGTGWVTEDQSDTECKVPIDIFSGTWNDLFGVLKSFWDQLPIIVKWGIAILILLAVPTLWRLVGGIVVEVISALILAIAIFLLMGLARPIWQDAWTEVGKSFFGSNAPDLALLLASIPLFYALISILRILTRKVFR